MADRAGHQDSLLTRHLLALFGELEAPALALLRDNLRWVEVAGGQALIEEGEAGDSMYIVISGRLRAYVNEPDGPPRMVREMGRGEVIGEMSLFTDEPRSASVVAVRDSVLVRLDKAPFVRLLDDSAHVGVALTRRIIQRLRTEHQASRHAAPVTIGVFAITEGIELRPFAERLAACLAKAGRVCIVDAATLAGIGMPEADAQAPIALQLDRLEAEHDFVLLLSDATPSAWTRLCARHSDELLLLADAARPPALHAVEAQCLLNRPPRGEAAEVLVLLHEAQARCPRDTAAWLARRPVADHVHVRPALDRDVARLARLLSRTAVGLVLAGGGARGFAHLGALRALQEQGIEFDCVGGTSMGSVMAALAAADQPFERLLAVARQAFRRNPTGDYNLLPLISLIRGRRLRDSLGRAIDAMYGAPVAIEDLWKNYYCIASNYSKARESCCSRATCAPRCSPAWRCPGRCRRWCATAICCATVRPSTTFRST